MLMEIFQSDKKKNGPFFLSCPLVFFNLIQNEFILLLFQLLYWVYKCQEKSHLIWIFDLKTAE